MSNYTPTIGLEVHAELNTKSKMFCGCANDPHAGEANSHVCPVCTGQPGTLPTPNQQAIAHVLLFGQAVGSTQASFSEFDRKNYFYPDIPKAYQISQYAYPFLVGGSLEGIQLTRVHLEEDTARSQHDKGAGSLVDFNRAGVPLMELVTEPVIHDAATAGAFARELQLMLRTLGISEANMEKGEMRVEANISISDSSELGTKVEVKNINSFKAVEAAISYELSRQEGLLKKGESITQETRGWDETKSRTFSQRSKETAKDYRYFPDPDLQKIDTSLYEAFSKSRIAEKLPVLPNKIREIYNNLGLPEGQIDILLSNRNLRDLFDSVTETSEARGLALTAANYLTSDILSLVKDGSYQLSNLNPKNLQELFIMLEDDLISSRGAKDLLPALFGHTGTTADLAAEKGVLQVSDDSELERIVGIVLATNEAAVAEYKAGKEAALKYLVGQGMKESKGSANPARLAEILQSKLL